ncbi:intermembrane transport protein PqiB [Kingella negevensis]|uniref:Paraquat-inducible protein B n=1 Tax=Kingella negevensis TaxID=1522312 RepID=A0A238HGU4_9NEIS|nr:intermembrane transport protein PqiB [Kingella negevensis]MDK4684774.1 intermembrane transport protein PqiB [Kingella negevensis]MDK4696662.1 intermembrane transport protein PqiB [Kingella negevensis]MDK4707315.1 intermembrane transport protein PqiB [Kingella negevensis]MDK4710207.1 intermembrane transport protein PqiB [Kingella negevensis]WII92632.1 intermembrane transport protein PqiB [Kingella negevensis]
MNPNNENLQTAKVRHSKTLMSTVWLIPVAAAIVGSYLFVQNVRSQGPEITLYMDNADGIAVETTSIRVLNVEVGRVSKIRLREDQKGVEITAKLNRESADLMRKDTQFWVVKPRIDQNGITGLGTLLSGSYIAFTPGTSTEEADKFTVADLPPVTAIGQTGLRLKLSGKTGKMVNVGSPVLYEDQVVGTVEKAKFDPTTRMVEYSIFIQSPNENLVNSGSRFWLDSGINVKMDGGGVKIDSAPLSALLSGAITFDTPVANEKTPVQAAKSGQSFEIYNNRAEIENKPNERTLYYVVFFNSSVRGLDTGSPVEYKGLRIGSVVNVPYFQDEDSHKLFQNGWIPVRVRIDPERIEQGSRAETKEYWQNTLQAALNKGLVATLASNNLVLGSKMVELTDAASDGTTLKPLAQYGGDVVIATRGGGFDDLQAQVSKLLHKFNALPLDKTVGELNGSLKELQTTLKSAQTMLASANKLASQSSTQNLPAELNKTLSELRQTLQWVSPQSPVYQDVQSTLNSLDRTLKNVQPVINTLKEKPNALIFNKGDQDPVPKGK